MDKVEEMDKFLETYNLPGMNQEEIENMSRLITSNEIKSIVKKKKKLLQTNKSLGPDGFIGEFY